jgi:hypothetical protein
MNNLQLATTLAAPTGIGLLYTAFEQGSDIAVWKNGSGATRSIVSMKRVQAKPTSAFVGTERIELKRTNYITVGAIEYTIVGSMVTSIPAAIATADRTAVFTQLALLARDPVFQASLESGVIPT